ncbi:MAG: restriction endonuclease subunit S [Burkholderiaceae bacterium]|jgi:type I restriction enzyme S subunit|nr:restriction endonuclease subunit S [Burkholderiaceae bacterium]MCU0966356.1 restriction endonuclease subunit S [Burkholderiaceae bacterium]
MIATQSRPIRDYSLGIFDGPHATPDEADDGPYFLGIKNITEDGRLDFSEPRFVSESEFPRWTKRVQPAQGDVVFTYEATLHRYALIPEGFRGCLGRRVALVRPDPTKVDSRFLLYYFLSAGWRAVVESNVISGATVDRIPLERFPTFPAALPPLPAQRRIVDVVAAYDDLIDNNRRRIKLLEDSVRLLFDEWFVNVGVSGWPTFTLQQLCVDEGGIQTGPFGSQLHQSDYAEEGVPVVMPKDLATMRIDTQTIARIPEHLADELGRHRMQRGDIVFGRRGEIGRRAYIGRRQVGYFCGTGCLRLRPDPARVHPRFLFEMLRAPAVAGEIANRAKGSTMANLSAGALQSVPVPMPPRALQDRFANFADDVAEQIDTLDEQSRKLRTARDLLLPRLMSGELTV